MTMHIVWSNQKVTLEFRLRIPTIYAIDAVHGSNNVYSTTIFPHNIGLGATRLVPYKISLVIEG